MKKILLAILLSLPLFALSQGVVVRSAPVSSNPAASNYNKQVLTDANLGVVLTFSIPVVTTPTFNNANPRVGAMVYATQDSSIYVWSGHSWLKSGQGGGGSGDTVSFTRNFQNLGTVTNAIIDLADNTTISGIGKSDSLFVAPNFQVGSSVKAPWYADNVITLGGDMAIASSPTLHGFDFTNNLYAVGPTLADWHRINSGTGAVMSILQDNSLSYYQANSGSAGASVTLSRAFGVNADGSISMPLLGDTTTAAKVIAINGDGKLLMVPFSGGGGSNLGNSDLTQTDPTRTFTIGTGDLVFNAKNGSDSTSVEITNANFTATSIAQSSGNYAQVSVSNNGGGDDTQAIMGASNSDGSKFKGWSSFTGGVGNEVSDDFDHVGILGFEVFPISGDPKQYAQYGKVDSLIAAAGSTFNFTNGLNQDGADVRLGGTLTEGTNIDVTDHDLDITNDDTRFGISGTIHLGAGGFGTDYTATGFTNQLIFRADERLISFGINNTADDLKSTAFGIDTVKGYFLLPGTRSLYQKGIQYSQLNFTKLIDSSLIPRKYAITLMDSVKATISGGTGTVTSITPGVGFLSHTSITTIGTMNIDTTSTIQTIANFFPKADTRYYTKTASDARYEVPLTFTSGVSRTSNTVKADTSVLRTVANSYSLSGMATKLSNYALTSSLPVAGNPSGLLTYTAANGSNTTFERTDGLHAIDSTVVRSVANSYSLSGMATKLSNYFLKTDTTAFAATLVHKATTETIAGKKTFTLAPVFSSVTASLPLAVDASKNLITSPVTGTGSTVVMSAGPTLTGNAVASRLDVTTLYAISNFSTTAGAILDGTAVLSMSSTAGQGSQSASVGQLLMGASVNNIRVGFGGTSGAGAVLSANGTAASTMFGKVSYRIATSGTNPIMTNVAILPLTIQATTGSGAATNSAALFIAGATTGATNNWSLWNIGLARVDSIQTTQFKFGGSFGTSGQMPIINGSGALSWVTAYTGLITGTPTIVAGTGAGTSPTVSVTTNGKQLQVTVTTGTLPTGTNATIATVTLPNALSYTPLPVFSSASAATALLNGASMIYMTSTGTANVTITSGTTALTAATTYVWNIVL